MKKWIFFFISALFVLNSSVLFAAEDLLEKAIAEYNDESYEEALEILIKVRENQPDSSTAAYYLGLTYKQVGDYQKAAEHLKEATPIVKDAYIELIDALHTLNELKEAEKWIMKAEKEDIQPANIAFLKGLVLLKKNANKDAVESFEKAKELDASLAQAADLQIAMAYTRERRFTEAKERLKAVIAIDPTSELATFAEEYEKSITKTLKMHKTWRFTAGISYQYDDNVILGPTTALISSTGDEITGEADSGFIGTFRIDHSPLLSGPWFVNTQFNLYGNYHFSITTHDVLMPTISFIPGYNLQKGAVTLPLSYSYIWLQGREYMSAISLKPTLNMMFLPDHIGQFSMGYANRALLQPASVSDENRDADVYSMSAGYVHPFSPFFPFSEKKGMLNIKYELSFDAAEGKNWDNIGNRINLGLLTPLKDKVSLMMSGDILFQDYKNIHSFSGSGAPAGYPDTPTKRKDKIFTGSATIRWEIRKDMNVNLGYSFTFANSNFPIYDYDRKVFNAGIEYTF